MLTSFKRIIHAGWVDFSRHLTLSISTIFVMAMMVLLITTLLLLNMVFKILIDEVQEKMDIAVYFKKEAVPEEIFKAKDELSKLSEVKDIEYVSPEQALEKFTEKHKDEPVILDALEELGENPFLASLNIKVFQGSQYEQVANFLKDGEFQDEIEKVDYYQRKPVIDKVFSIIASVNRAGLILSIVLAVIAVLLAFNTIRIAIYNSNEELKIMRLVGASNRFIRGPFIIQGVISGLFAAILVFLLTWGICFGLDAQIKTIMPEVSTYNIFISNIWLLILIQLASSIGVGIISSLIAIRKYLKI